MLTSMEVTAYLLILNCFATEALQARNKYFGQLKLAMLKWLIYFLSYWSAFAESCQGHVPDKDRGKEARSKTQRPTHTASPN